MRGITIQVVAAAQVLGAASVLAPSASYAAQQQPPESTPTGETASVAWMTPEGARNHVRAGSDVWSIQPLQIAAEGVFGNVGAEVHLIEGLSDRFYASGAYYGGQRPPIGCAIPGKVINADGTIAVELNFEPIPESYLSIDLRRVIFFKDGDLHRGEVDWSTGEIINQQQVTQVGQFMYKPVLAWSGNIVLIKGDFSPEKPIVRIDLASGALEEIAAPPALISFPQGHLAGFANPSGGKICFFAAPDAREGTDDLLHVYDVQTGESSEIESAFTYTLDAPTGPMVQKVPTLAYDAQRALWIDDDTLIIAGRIGLIAKFDLRANTSLEVHTATQPYAPEFVSFSPGGEYAHMSEQYRDPRTDRAVPRRFIVDLRDGQRIPLEFATYNVPTWLDDSKLLYLREDAGLSENGTWLFDAKAGTNVRLAPQLSKGACAIAPDRILFFSASPKAALILVSTGGEIIEQADGGSPSEPISAEPIDLGFGTSDEDLWNLSP